MRLFVVLSSLACALALPTAAIAGGWASVGFDPLPDGTSAGATWEPTIFVKQHGVTPLDGLQPVVLIENVESGSSEQFYASPGSGPGIYEADVVFPSAGDWRVTIDSGFGESTVTYGPVSIAEGGPSGGSGPLQIVGFGVVTLAVVGALLLLTARRARRLTPANG